MININILNKIHIWIIGISALLYLFNIINSKTMGIMYVIAILIYLGKSLYISCKRSKKELIEDIFIILLGVIFLYSIYIA